MVIVKLTSVNITNVLSTTKMNGDLGLAQQDIHKFIVNVQTKIMKLNHFVQVSGIVMILNGLPLGNLITLMKIMMVKLMMLMIGMNSLCYWNPVMLTVMTSSISANITNALSTTKMHGEWKLVQLIIHKSLVTVHLDIKE